MTKPAFTWYPDEGGTEGSKPDVASTKFGDGYEQRVAKGINSKAVSWSLKFTGSVDEVLPIRAFLSARNGVESFQWINQFGELDLYVCREWTAIKLKASIIEISAKFERVYEANI